MTDSPRVFCATDLGSSGASALRWAAAWAADTDGKVELVHACDDVALDEALFDDCPDEIEPALVAYRERLMSQRKQLEDKLSAEAALVEGATWRFVPDTPWRALVDVSEEDRAACLVLGPHASGLRLLGTTAGRVIRHAACPVLVCEGDLEPPKSFRGAKWLCGVDTEAENAHAIVERARTLAARQGAELVLLRVLPEAVTAGGSSLVASWTADATKALSRYVEGGHIAGVRVTFGDPAEELIEAAKSDPEVNLLVLATHGRKGLARIALGSVTEKVIREAEMPCLVIRGG